MSNNFKIDIGSMVKQVDDLTKAMEQLGVLAQGVFGTLGRAADVFGGKMTSAGQSSAPRQASSSDMLSESGQSAISAFDSAITRGLQAQAISKAGVNVPGSPYVASFADPAALIMEKHSTSHGTKMSATGFSGSSLKEAIAAGEIARAQKEAYQNQQMVSAQSFVSPATSPSVRAAFGYGAKDLVRLTGQTGNIDGLSKNLADLSNNFSSSNKEVSKSLLMLQGELRDRLSSFNTATTAFGAAGSEDEQKRAMAELTQTMKRLDNTISEAKEAEQQARQLAGGGGGSGGGFLSSVGASSPGDFLRKFGPALFGTASVLGTGMLSGEVALRSATAGKRLDLMQYEGNIAQSTFRSSMEAADMSSAENLLRYRGDMLFPGKFNYLGAQGQVNAFSGAKEIHDQNVALMRAERNLGVFGSGVGALSGIGVMAGSIAAGGPLGMIGGLMGFNQTMSSVSGGIKDYYTNPLTLAEGGLTGSFMGRTIGGISGLSMGEMRMAETAAKRKMDVEQFASARALQDAEIQQNPSKVAGINEILERQRAEQQGALLVGGYAASRGTFDRTLTRSYAAGRAARDRAVAEAEAERDSLNSKIAGIDTTLHTGGSMFSAPIGTYQAIRGRPLLIQKMSQMKADADRKVAESQGMEISGGPGRSPAAALGMSTSEYMLASSKLANVMGYGISGNEMTSSGITTSMLRMSKGGLGSFDEMVSGVGRLNQVAGGDNNARRFESMMVTAVSAGFDKSRMAQQFVQTSTELAKAVQSTSPEEMAKRLSFTASSMSATGRADELSLGQAAKGIGDLAAYTGQSGGFMGSMKMMGVYGSGGVIGTGANMLAGSNLDQMLDYQRQLESGNITDPRLQRLVRVSGGAEQAKRSLQGAIVGAGAPLRAGLEMGLTPAMKSKYGASSIQDLVSKGSGLSGKARSEFIQDFMALSSESGANVGMSEEGSMRYAATLLEGSGFKAKSDRSQFDRAISAGLAKSVTPAEQNLRQYVDSLYGREMTEMRSKPVSRGEYLDYITKGQGGTVRVGKEELTEAKLMEMQSRANSGDSEAANFLKKADAEIGKMDRFNMAQSAQYNLSSMRNEQRVYVTNMAEVTYWLKGLDSRIAK